MGILLVRHAAAVEADAQLEDAARFLSERGRAQARACSRELAKRGLTFDRLVTSPRVRAVQTAELFAEALGFQGVVETLPALCFTASPRTAASALSAMAGNVAAFGHMPTIAETLRILLGGSSAGGLATSEAVWIDHGSLAFRLGAPP